MIKKKNLQKELENYLINNREAHYRLAYSYLKNKEDALDVLQESTYKAFRTLEKQNSNLKIKSWFYKILINTSIDFIRKHKKITLVDDIDFQENQKDYYKDLDLEKALDNLDEHLKSIIILRYFEDFKLEEIGKILDVNTNTVKTRLYKALKLLRVDLEENKEDLNHEKN
ncbi:RNA polymerase subunit sigma-70 [Natranaerobius trueperi]|uniref:RNA polymerase subunit sigma-70 n=1 Tax=Natranaerobius trueperi TaxID=759412 RepID=A0A226C3N7_9FIRM|nr:sigma-70 family RNA polymerase sigma factor [Natranaerobius trueperi]OWZ85030.1 RNA polymerase subunit sigma-70 [Natranaerobius trueperi]